MRITAAALPGVGAGIEVFVRLKASGVCHRDLNAVDGPLRDAADALDLVRTGHAGCTVLQFN